MERWQNRVAVVTGASSGIGEAIAKDLIAAGLKVVALGRRQERLKDNRSKIPIDDLGRLYSRKCDVTDEADVIATFDWIEQNLGGVDILVNNAGVVRYGNMLEMDMADIDVTINTNVRGLICCTRAAFKSMKSRNVDGHIVNINSIAGHSVVTQGNTSLNIYPPSKFAVTAINEAIRNELRILETRIKTTSISPGAVHTEIVPDAVVKHLPKILEPEDISQAVLFAISTPPHVQIHEMTVRPLGFSM